MVPLPRSLWWWHDSCAMLFTCHVSIGWTRTGSLQICSSLSDWYGQIHVYTCTANIVRWWNNPHFDRAHVQIDLWLESSNQRPDPSSCVYVALRSSLNIPAHWKGEPSSQLSYINLHYDRSLQCSANCIIMSISLLCSYKWCSLLRLIWSRFHTTHPSAAESTAPHKL